MKKSLSLKLGRTTLDLEITRQYGRIYNVQLKKPTEKESSLLLGLEPGKYYDAEADGEKFTVLLTSTKISLSQLKFDVKLDLFRSTEAKKKATRKKKSE